MAKKGVLMLSQGLRPGPSTPTPSPAPIATPRLYMQSYRTVQTKTLIVDLSSGLELDLFF